MALRTFRSNPNLGGFGSESTVPHLYGGSNANASEDCDAFAQIIKELVDNAVDACSISAKKESKKKKNNKQKQVSDETHQNKRVRVVIERFVAPSTGTTTRVNDSKHNDNDNDDDANLDIEEGNDNETNDSATQESPIDNDTREILRVIVSDNGCGMDDIQSCVEAFRSSKTGHDDEQQTAGRYGIGLTLCLLHAQRLVPNSCASITSATSKAGHFTKAQYVVDTEGDSVRCVDRSLLPKTTPTESGTSVSLLVPVSRK